MDKLVEELARTIPSDAEIRAPHYVVADGSMPTDLRTGQRLVAEPTD